MPSPEWVVECGIGETRAALIDQDRIIEARIELEGAVPAGTVIAARLADVGTDRRNALAIGEDGAEYLLPRGVLGVTQGAVLAIEVTRGAIPGIEPWKRALARVCVKPVSPAASLGERLGGRELVFPGVSNVLADAGWDDLVDEARTGTIRFAGGELRMSPTPAMTFIDVDGYLPPADLALVGARNAACALRRMDIGGSIGIDLPTSGNKLARQAAADAIDAELPQPFERTAVNGFGFVQIIRPRLRPSLIELAQDRAAFEARALLRRAALESAGAKALVANPAVIAVLQDRQRWIATLSRQLAGPVSLRADAAISMSGGYAEKV